MAPTREEQIKALKEDVFDVLVIGGGCVGSGGELVLGFVFDRKKGRADSLRRFFLLFFLLLPIHLEVVDIVVCLCVNIFDSRVSAVAIARRHPRQIVEWYVDMASRSLPVHLGGTHASGVALRWIHIMAPKPLCSSVETRQAARRSVNLPQTTHTRRTHVVVNTRDNDRDV